MASTLKVNSILFADSTSLSSYYNVVPKNTKMFFHRASAPTGWTTDTSLSDQSLLRVVTGNGTGGVTSAQNFSQVLSSPYSISASIPITISGLQGGGTTLTSAQIPSHSHPSGHSASATATALLRGAGPGPAGIYMARFGGPKNTLQANGPWQQGLLNNSGGGGSHSHTLTYSSNSSVSQTVSFAIKYIDIILCSRN